MIKSILKFVSAPVAVAAFLLLGTKEGRKLTKKVAREAVKGGLQAADTCKVLVEQAKEKGSELAGQVKEATSTLCDQVKESTSNLIAEADTELTTKRIEEKPVN